MTEEGDTLASPQVICKLKVKFCYNFYSNNIKKGGRYGKTNKRNANS